MDQPTPESRSTLINVPVHNFIDNFTMTRGRHTFSAGVNWRIIHNNRNSDQLSFSEGNTNEYWLANGGAIANQSIPGAPQSLDPAGFNLPAVDAGFANSYNIAIGLLTGLVPQVTGNYNYSGFKGWEHGDATRSGDIPRPPFQSK